MDNTIVHSAKELATAWGSSVEEFESDVFEHSRCGIKVKADDRRIMLWAVVDTEQTKIRFLTFPFTMTEFEAVLRTVEHEAESIAIRLLTPSVQKGSRALTVTRNRRSRYDIDDRLFTKPGFF